MTSTMRFDKWENSLGQPYGTVLQVVQAVKTDTQTGSLASPNFVDIIGLSAQITPKSSSSKILIMTTINGSATYDGLTRIVRNSTPIGVGTASTVPTNGGSFIGTRGVSYEGYTSQITFLDSPATTSAITYKSQITCNGAYYINSTPVDGVNAEVTMSSITLMEIAQ